MNNMSRNPYLAASRPFTRSSRSSKRTDLSSKSSSLARSRSTTGLCNSYSSAAGYTPTSSCSSTAGWSSMSNRPTSTISYDLSYNSKQHSSSIKSLPSIDQDDTKRSLASGNRYSRNEDRQSSTCYDSPRSNSLSRASSLSSPVQSFEKESPNDDSNSVKLFGPIIHKHLYI